MNTPTNRRKSSNEISIAPLFKWLLVAIFLGGCGLLYVFVKNQQHFIGQQTRDVERQITALIAYNEALEVKISALSSRTELQQKLEQGLIALQPIQDHYIARLTPPASAEPAGVLHTAANEGFRQ